MKRIEKKLQNLSEQDRELYLALWKKGRFAIRLNLILQAITFLTMAASIVLYFVEEERGLDITVNHVFQCVCALIILNVPLFIQRKFRCYFPNFITVVLYVWVFAHFVLGEIFRAYDRIFLYDKLLHTTGGVVFAILSFSVVWLLNNREGVNKLSPFFIVLFTFCFAMTAEYIWELIEWALDRLFGSNMQRWQDSIIEGAEIIVNGRPVDGTAHSKPYGNGLSDTMGDMFINIVGCLVVCIVSYVGLKTKPHWFENKVILTEKQFLSLLERENEETSAANGDALPGSDAVSPGPAEAPAESGPGQTAPAETGAGKTAEAEPEPEQAAAAEPGTEPAAPEKREGKAQ